MSRLYNNSSLLITDYSSIAFDFMFLDTPVIFYKFDADVNYPDEDDNITGVLEIALDIKESPKIGARLYEIYAPGKIRWRS